MLLLAVALPVASAPLRRAALLHPPSSSTRILGTILTIPGLWASCYKAPSSTSNWWLVTTAKPNTAPDCWLSSSNKPGAAMSPWVWAWNIALRGEGPQAGWITNFALSNYRGRVYQDGVQAMIDTILASKAPITLPCHRAHAEPGGRAGAGTQIAQRTRFVGMDGSVRVGYGGSAKVDAEWNVKADVKAAQHVFSAQWEMVITPLDTCGLIDLSGDRYRRLRDSANPTAAAVIENYRVWSTSQDPKNKAAESHSSTLFDTVAVYLAIQHDLCHMEQLGLRVTDEGFTVIHDLGLNGLPWPRRGRVLMVTAIGSWND